MQNRKLFIHLRWSFQSLTFAFGEVGIKSSLFYPPISPTTNGTLIYPLRENVSSLQDGWLPSEW
jgi:hypothetical protein